MVRFNPRTPRMFRMSVWSERSLIIIWMLPQVITSDKRYTLTDNWKILPSVSQIGRSGQFQNPYSITSLECLVYFSCELLDQPDWRCPVRQNQQHMIMQPYSSMESTTCGPLTTGRRGQIRHDVTLPTTCAMCTHCWRFWARVKRSCNALMVFIGLIDVDVVWWIIPTASLNVLRLAVSFD